MQKHLRKLTALALATVMVFSLANFPVYAEGTESADDIISQKTLNEEAVGTEETVDGDTAQTKTEAEEGTSTSETEPTEGTGDTDNALSLSKTLAEIGEEVEETNEIQTLANNAGDFNVEGTAGDWLYIDNVISINNSGEYTITGDRYEHSGYQIKIAGDIEVYLTLEDVKISNPAGAAMDITNTSTVTLKLVGENSFTAGNYSNAGIQFKNATSGSLTITSDSNGSLTATGGMYGAGIGGEWYSSGRNITISGGTVNASGGTYGAGIGGGMYDSGRNITINGGTVTATGGMYGAGIGASYGGSGSDIVITGGSVKASRISVTPTNGSGSNVYLCKIERLSGVNSVTVDGSEYTRNGDHPGDGAFYLYLTGEDHEITANGTEYRAEWQSSSRTFLLKQYLSAPTVEIESKTSTSITVQELPDTGTYGDAEYSLDGTIWQDSREFTELTPDMQYTVYARYKGNDSYLQSEAGNTTVTTKKDGAKVITEPANLTATYEDTLADVTLTTGWLWVDNATAVSVGTNTYPARFDTKEFENEYDFSNVDGYDENGQYVERALTVTTSKATPKADHFTFKEPADLAYSGTDKTVTVKAKDGIAGMGDIEKIEYSGNDGISWSEDAPVNAGTYLVRIAVANGENYSEATVDSADWTFTISQATNEWTSNPVLSIDNWTYGETAKEPTAEAKFGTVEFTYSNSKDGTYTSDIPTDAGTWYVKATVPATENYTSLESDPVAFTILKAGSTISFKDDFSLDKDYDGNTVTATANNVTVTGSTGTISFTWQQSIEGEWTDLAEAPVNTGTYKVIATVTEDNNHNSASSELEFTISQATNEWITEPSIDDWTFNETAGTPSAEAKFGEVEFTYSDSEDGNFTDAVPTEAGTWYVKATVAETDNYTGMEEIFEFEILRADRDISFADGFSLDKDYDGKEVTVSTENVTVSVGEGDITFTWYEKDGEGWTLLSSAPVNAGTYKVVATVAAYGNYGETMAEMEFAISQAENEWTEELAISGWTQGGNANTPSAEAKFGEVVFTYSNSENGTYTSDVPTRAGIWYVKATVAETDNYTGLEAIQKFEITKPATGSTQDTDNGNTKTEDSTQSASTNVKTGDSTNLAGWFTLLALSLSGAVLATLSRRRVKK